MEEKLYAALTEFDWEPLDGRISVLLVDRLLAYYRYKRKKKLVKYHLIGDRKEYELDKISREDILEICEEPATVMDEDGEVVITCFYDDCTSFLFSKEADCESIIDEIGCEAIILQPHNTLLWYINHEKIHYRSGGCTCIQDN